MNDNLKQSIIELLEAAKAHIEAGGNSSSNRKD